MKNKINELTRNGHLKKLKKKTVKIMLIKVVILKKEKLITF